MRKRGFLVLALIVGGCNSSSTSKVSPGADAAAGGSGGKGTGGVTSAGSASGGGGSNTTGTQGSGGGLGSGGTSATGGSAGGGGAVGLGGSPGTGGVSSTGGATGGTQGDAAADSRSDVATATGGGTGTGGTATGSGGAGTDGAGNGGAGGTLADAGRDSGGDARLDLPSDPTANGRVDTGTYTKPVAVPDGGTCPYTGHVSYTFTKSGDTTVDNLITAAMDQAVAYYNCYTNITKADNVVYDPSVATADGNSNGTIHFGSDASYMILRVAMHEISHTVGVGQAANWLSFIARPDGGSSGPWTGANGIAQRQALLPDVWQQQGQEVLTADTQHFWPYGLNLASDYKSEADLLGHCAMVMAIRKDLGLK
jgi:hypothetical protein